MAEALFPDEEAAPAPAPADTMPSWPPALIDAELALDVLSEALGETVGTAPPIVFLRTVGPVDRDLLAAAPSEVVLPAALGREFMARRYGLFLLMSQKPTGRVRVDDGALRAIENTVTATLDQIHAVSKKFMAEGNDAARKEASAAHGTLSRALGDLKTLANRLAGQQSAGPLDGDGHRVAQFEMQSSKVVAPAPVKEPEFKKGAADERSSRTPMIVVGLLLSVALSTFLVIRQFPKSPVKKWDPKAVSALANVSSVAVKGGRGVVVVGAAWKPDPAVLVALQQKLRDSDIASVVVIDGGGHALAVGTVADGLTPVAK